MDNNYRKETIPPTIHLLPAKDDQIFKSLLTRDEPESKIILKDVLYAVIGRPITEVVVRNNEPATTDINQKQERFDVNCVTDDGEQCNIEMQSSPVAEKPGANHRNLKSRLALYASDLHSGQPAKGKNYDELVKTYQITFVSYTIFADAPNQFVNHFTLRNENGRVLTEDLNIVTIELSKLKRIIEKPPQEMTSLEMWGIFFEYADDLRYREVINRIIEAKGEIGMASTLLQSISQDEYERARYMSKRKFETDLESDRRTYYLNGMEKGMEKGLKKGKAEGKAEGIAEGKADMVRQMLLFGMPPTEVQLISKLTLAEIEQIRTTL